MSCILHNRNLYEVSGWKDWGYILNLIQFINYKRYNEIMSSWVKVCQYRHFCAAYNSWQCPVTINLFLNEESTDTRTRIVLKLPSSMQCLKGLYRVFFTLKKKLTTQTVIVVPDPLLPGMLTDHNDLCMYQ